MKSDGPVDTGTAATAHGAGGKSGRGPEDDWLIEWARGERSSAGALGLSSPHVVVPQKNYQRKYCPNPALVGAPANLWDGVEMGEMNTFLHVADDQVVRLPRRSNSDPTSNSSSRSSSAYGAGAQQEAAGGSRNSDPTQDSSPRKGAQDATDSLPRNGGGRPILSMVMNQARQMTMEDVNCIVPVDPRTGEPTSIGSLMHEYNRCKPCVKFNSPEGCKRAGRCRYCHFEHDPNQQRTPKQRDGKAKRTV